MMPDRDLGQTSIQSAKSLVSIQVLRAVAATAVVVGHLNPEFATFGPKAHALLPDFSVGAYGVDLFFVISGFVMVYASERYFGQPDGPKQFFLRRLARIVPLYWVATTAMLAYLIVLRRGNIAGEDLSWSAVAGSYAFLPLPRPSGLNVPVLGVGWTLNIEMFFYSVFALAVLVPRRRAVLTASMLLVVTVTAGQLLGHSPVNSPSAAWNPVLLEFIYGMLIGVAYREGLRFKLPIVMLCIFVAIIYFAAIWSQTVVFYDPRLRALGPGIVACLIVGGLVLSEFRTASNLFIPLVLLGDASYALYLSHNLVMMVSRWPLNLPGMINPLLYPAIYAIVLVGICLFVAVAVHLLFERPCTRYLQRQIAARQLAGRRLALAD
jgi:exopolysaccharide production protein ExoZ